MIAFFLWDAASDRLKWAGGWGNPNGIPVTDLPDTMEQWNHRIAPFDRSRVRSAWQRLLGERTPLFVEYSIGMPASGCETRYVLSYAAFIDSSTVVGCITSTLLFPKAIFQQMGVAGLGGLIVDSRGTIGFANDAAGQIFGYSVGELVGACVDRLVPDSVRERHAGLREAFFSTPTPRLMAGRGLTGRRKDGTSVPVAVGLHPLGGDQTHVLCSIFDLTEVVAAREDLARFFELSPDLFCIADFRGFFLKVNSNFQRILGYTEEELLSRPFLDFVHPEDRAATVEQMLLLREGRDVIQFRNRYRNGAGSYRWFEWTARPAPDAEVTFAVARDVTERIVMEMRLHSREQREKALLDSVATPIFVRDQTGRFEFCNRSFQESFGIPAASLVGRTPREICSESLADFLERGDQDALQSGCVVTREDVVEGPSGPRSFVTSRIPLFEGDGAMTGVASVATDITEQIRALEAEREMELARTVQQKLYPKRAPTIPGFQLAGSARPVTQLCGDYFDYVPRGEGRCCVIVGDVSGHGFGSALQMVELRALLRTLLRRSQNLAEILEEVNQELFHDLPESMFISLFMLELDSTVPQFRYVSAGHPAWLLPAREKPRMLRSTGLVLGLVPDADYGNDADWSPLDSGDILVLPTDGVFEAATEEQELFGRSRLEAAIMRHRDSDASDILEALFTEVYEFVDGCPVKDDMTAVVVKKS